MNLLLRLLLPCSLRLKSAVGRSPLAFNEVDLLVGFIFPNVAIRCIYRELLPQKSRIACTILTTN